MNWFFSLAPSSSPPGYIYFTRGSLKSTFTLSLLASFFCARLIGNVMISAYFACHFVNGIDMCVTKKRLVTLRGDCCNDFGSNLAISRSLWALETFVEDCNLIRLLTSLFAKGRSFVCKQIFRYTLVSVNSLFFHSFLSRFHSDFVKINS